MMTTTVELPAAPASTATPVARKRSARAAELLHPRAAAVELQPDFRVLARHFSSRDMSTQDDLVQEMTLAVLLSPASQPRSAFRLLAAWRARDYMRWWRDPSRPRPSEPARSLDGAPADELEKHCQALNRMLGVDD